MPELINSDPLETTASDSIGKQLGQTAQLEAELVQVQQQLDQLPKSADRLARSGLMLEIARRYQLLERGEKAWPLALEAFSAFSGANLWQEAVECCDVLYQADQPDSLVALANGIWLGVTFPIDPELSIHLLSHLIEDTPDDSDGAAIAAATALFLADVRAATGPEKERLTFFANQLLGRVAQRHSDIKTQQQFDLWVDRLELDQPDKILVRLRNVIDVLAQDDWWIDREALQEQLD